MKRKAIEKIPYLTLPKVVRKRTAKYVGVTALQEIAGEQHLLLEVYRNRGDAKEIPLVRIVLTKKDFGNYFPEADEWTKQKIEVDHYYDRRLIWNEPEGFLQDGCSKEYPSGRSRSGKDQEILYRTHLAER